MINRICNQCNKDFSVFLSVVKKGKGKFCSKYCKNKWQSENLKGENSLLWKRISVNCLICNKAFNAKLAVTKRGSGKFCSNKCRGKWISAHNRGENNPCWRGGLIIHTCLECKNEFKVFPYRDKTKETKFCSRICHGEWNSKNRIGPFASGWKGGITPINLQIRHSKEAQSWRKSVFERDDYTCQHCGQRGGKLNADHIKPFALFIELRFAIDNGRTLCVDCHRKIGWRGSHI